MPGEYLRLNFSEQAGRPPCSLDPFFIMPDKCKCVDFQVLKLQELPDFIPQVRRRKKPICLDSKTATGEGECDF